MSLPKNLTKSNPRGRFREPVDWSAHGYLLRLRWLKRVEAIMLPGITPERLGRGVNEREIQTMRRNGVTLYDRDSLIAYLQRRDGLPRALRQCPTCHGIFASTEHCATCDQ